MNAREVYVDIPVGISVENFIQVVTSELSHNELYRLVVQLDNDVADWGFTERLFKYFKNQMVIKDEEEEL